MKKRGKVSVVQSLIVLETIIKCGESFDLEATLFFGPRKYSCMDFALYGEMGVGVKATLYGLFEWEDRRFGGDDILVTRRSSIVHAISTLKAYVSFMKITGSMTSKEVNEIQPLITLMVDLDIAESFLHSLEHILVLHDKKLKQFSGLKNLVATSRPRRRSPKKRS